MIEYPPGWTCEKTVMQFEYYFANTLERVQALALAEHLEACQGCAQRMVLFRVTIRRSARD
jgi:hypothetical protein